MIIRIIHGIHYREESSNVAAFAPVLQKIIPNALVSVFSYGFMGFWAARFQNLAIAKRLAFARSNTMGEREVWITHSNGAAIAYLATKVLGAKPDMIINFNPALDRWRVAPVSQVETIHSDQDRWVDLSRFLPFHLWGDQGKVGIAKTPYHAVEHLNYCCHNATKFGPGMAYKDHTGAFTANRREAWAYFIAQRLSDYFPGT